MSCYFIAQIRINDEQEYREILKHRLQAADCDTILVQGQDE